MGDDHLSEVTSDLLLVCIFHMAIEMFALLTRCYTVALSNDLDSSSRSQVGLLDIL